MLRINAGMGMLYGGAGATSANYAAPDSVLDMPLLMYEGFSVSIRDIIFISTAFIAVCGFIVNNRKRSPEESINYLAKVIQLLDKIRGKK